MDKTFRELLRYFRRDIRKRRGTLIGGASFGLIYALARVAEPWPLKVVFDQVLFRKPAHGPIATIFTPFGRSPYAILAAAGLALALIGVVRAVSYYYEDSMLSRAAQQIVYGIRTRLYAHLHRLPLAYHQQRKAGDTLVRLSSDVVLLRDVLVDAIVSLGTGVLQILLMIVVMALIDPVLTGVALLVMPVVFVLSYVYGRRIRVNSQKQRKREGQVAAAMHEALSSMAIVQLHGASGREQERFHAINRRSLKQGVASTRLEAQMFRSVEITLGAGVALLLSFGSIRTLHGALTPGELIVFVMYLRAAYRPLQRASKTVQRAAKAQAAAERIVEVLEVKPALRDKRDAKEAPPLEGKIAFEGVSFAYHPGQEVIQDLSLTIEPGTHVALVGPSGGGKSTLLSLVPRLFDTTSGRVTVDGMNVTGLTLDSLRAQITLVLQESVLFGLSIAENIRYGAPDASDEEIETAARAARVHDVIMSFPDGYETVLTERGQTLSGGQRQRIALARALVRRTPILLLDEPTTGLDAATQAELVAVLREEILAAKTTVVIATHDPRLIQAADEVVMVDGGRIAAQGTYSDLLDTSEAFRWLIAEDSAPRALQRTRPKADGASPERVLFYSHNGVGVGHLQRQLDLATAYHRRHPESAVLLATGSRGASMFEFPEGIDYLKLPSLQMVDRYRNWEPRDLPLPRETVTEMRAEMLRETVRNFAPDLLVADFMPAGPYGELLPALDELKRQGGAAIAGFRDIVDEPGFVRELWEETGVYETLRDHYAEVCVYGDPAVMDFTEYGLGPAAGIPLQYCGYLGRSEPARATAPAQHGPYVLATSGGGADGSLVLDQFLHAAELLRPELGGRWLAVSGPLMADDDHERLVRLGARFGVDVRRVVPELRCEVAAADCIVAMAGYNTVCDVLSYRRPAVLVPRSGPSLEQTLRADRLESWNAAEVIRASELSSREMARAIRSVIDRGEPELPPISLDGVQNALDVLDTALAHARAA
ncbi:MAG: ATP-binding cassette, subfamily bacterial [Gaiellaceae bacterium]|jgi:ATP-binding cassette subfamily B protein|nr:ATP-binding cassette, subfamily bacterial [Gaiellaceae bacterium]